MHLSMRVPWMDRPWDGAVCNAPRANGSCVLLKNIGPKRDDMFEVDHAGQPFAQLDSGKLPRLSERSAFMSDTGYRVSRNIRMRRTQRSRLCLRRCLCPDMRSRQFRSGG